MSFSVFNESLSPSDISQLTSSSVVSLDRIDPVTKTASFTVNSHDVYIVNGASILVTLPSAALFPGRVLHFVNKAAQAVLSVANDVVPNNSTTLGNSILAAAIGNSSTLVSNGVNWYNVRATTV